MATSRAFIYPLLTVVLLLFSPAVVLAQEPLPSSRTGGTIYMQSQSCVQCHGDQGKGDGPVAADLQVPPTDFTDPAWWMDTTPNEIFEVIKEGRMDRFMPPWKNQLSDEQIWDTTYYVWSLRTTDVQYQQGQQTFEEQCADCHGDAGDTPFTDLDRYAGQSTQDWLQAIQQGTGEHPTFLELSEEGQLAVVEYARAFTYRSPYAALVAGDGVVTGQVMIGTPGSSGSVSDLAVTLHTFEGTTPTGVQEATSDEEGRFRFEQLPTDSSLMYYATVGDYEGVLYNSDVLPFGDGVTELPLPITVFETTTDAAGIQIERVHLILEFDQSAIFVGELYLFSNLTDRTYIGSENEEGQQEVLRFTVPSIAEGLGIEGGGLGSRYLLSDTGFFDTQPLLPGRGQRQVIFRYAIPYDSPRLRLIRELLYPAANVNVLVADVGVRVTTPRLTQEGKQGAGENTYLNFVGTDFAAGENLEVTLENLPQLQTVSTAVTNTSTTLIVGLVVGALFIVGAVGYALMRQRTPPPAPVPTAPRRRKRDRQARSRPPEGASAAELQAEQQRLIQMIAALDDAFDGGELEEADYQQQRESLKETLLSVARRLQNEDAA